MASKARSVLVGTDWLLQPSTPALWEQSRPVRPGKTQHNFRRAPAPASRVLSWLRVHFGTPDPRVFKVWRKAVLRFTIGRFLYEFASVKPSHI